MVWWCVGWGRAIAVCHCCALPVRSGESSRLQAARRSSVMKCSSVPLVFMSVLSSGCFQPGWSCLVLGRDIDFGRWLVLLRVLDRLVGGELTDPCPGECRDRVS